MLSPIEYKQVAFDAEKPEGLTPTFLTRGQMDAKLKEFGVSPSSALGKHALSGGRLWSPKGELFQLAGLKAVGAFLDAPPAATVNTSQPSPDTRSLLDIVADIYCGTDSRVEASTTSAPSMPQLEDEHARREAQLKASADAWCGAESE